MSTQRLPPFCGIIVLMCRYITPFCAVITVYRLETHKRRTRPIKKAANKKYNCKRCWLTDVLVELFAAINAANEPRDSFTAIIASNCRLILANASFATIYRIFAKLYRAAEKSHTGASRLVTVAIAKIIQ